MSRALLYAGVLSLPWLALRVQQMAISDALLLASLLLALLSRPFRQSRPATPAVQLGLFLALFGATISELRDPEPASGVGVIARLLFVWGIWLWQAKQLLDTQERIARAIRLFVAGCVVSSAAAVGQYRFGLDIPGSELTNAFRASGLAQHVNDQGAALAVALVLAFAGLTATHGRARLTWLAAAVSCAIGLVLAGSVTGMLAALFGILAGLSLQGLSPRAIFMTAGGLVGAGWLALSLQAQTGTGSGSGLTPLERFAVATGRGPRTQDTTDDRLDTWRAAWEQIGANPFLGKGFSEASRRVVGETQTHNSLLALWLAGGIFVLLGVCIIVVAAVTAGRKLPTSLERTQLLSGLMASALFAMTAPILYQRHAWFPVVMILSLAAISREGLKAQRKYGAPPRRAYP